MAAANRRTFVILATGVAVAAALFWVVLSVPRQISPEQLAADVKAQQVRRTARGSPKAARPASPIISSKLINVDEATATLEKTNSTGNTATKYSFVGFQKLSAFRFFITDQMVDKASDSLAATPGCLAQIPDDVKALNDKDVSISGFMLPMKFEGKLATEFLLLRNQSLCCYGKAPTITEWVTVKAPGKGVKPIMDVPVTVSGVFHVGDVRENGELVGIYSLDAQILKGP